MAMMSIISGMEAGILKSVEFVMKFGLFCQYLSVQAQVTSTEDIIKSLALECVSKNRDAKLAVFVFLCNKS